MYIAQYYKDSEERERAYHRRCGDLKKYLEWSLRTYMASHRIKAITASWNEWVARAVANPPSYFNSFDKNWPLNMDLTWKTMRNEDREAMWQAFRWEMHGNNAEDLAEVEVKWEQNSPQSVTLTLMKLFKSKTVRSGGDKREVVASGVDETFNL